RLRQPRSPLFPYTTLFRSHVDARDVVLKLDLRPLAGDVLMFRVDKALDVFQRLLGDRVLRRYATGAQHPGEGDAGDAGRLEGARSEEHTSELQSRFDLVCR